MIETDAGLNCDNNQKAFSVAHSVSCAGNLRSVHSVVRIEELEHPMDVMITNSVAEMLGVMIGRGLLVDCKEDGRNDKGVVMIKEKLKVT